MQAETTKKVRKRWFALFTQELVVLLLLLLTTLIIFAYAADLVFIRKRLTFDENIFAHVGKLTSPGLTKIMVVISFLGKHTFLIPAYLVLLVYYMYKHFRWYSIRVIAVALSSLLLMFSLKLSFQRLRPDIPLLEKVNGYSFPSGHALMSASFYGLLIYITWKEVKNKTAKWIITILLVLLVLTISFSRVYLRVHYASDIIAGLAAGLFWILLSMWTIGKIEKRYILQRSNSEKK
jgi:membrane-associated phospholipid phosphatase